MAPRSVAPQELAQHSSASSCWTAIHGQVYDVTEFLTQHPGGAALLLSVAGRDGTREFEGAHSGRGQLLLEASLPASALVGDFDPSGEPSGTIGSQKATGTGEPEGVPPIGSIINLDDMRRVSKRQLIKQAWDYYDSGAETESTLRENELAFQRVFLRPRVLVKTSGTSLASSILRQACSFPVYISGSAMVGMAHPEGECLLMRAAAAAGIPYMAPTLSSKPTEDIAAARAPGQPSFFQLYVSSDRQRAAGIVRKAEALGFQAIFLTVDVPITGRRETDMRNSFVDTPPSEVTADAENADKSKGVIGMLQSFFDPDLCWDDITWLRSLTKLPIVLKGIQTGEDALLAARHPEVAGIVVSNHGGRQLDYARSSLEVLEEVTVALQGEGLRGRLEVFLDGGVRRGTDVFKALAMGADAVGLSRPVLWGVAAYGQLGAEKVLDMLRVELETAMRLMGTRSIPEIGPHCLSRRRAANSRL